MLFANDSDNANTIFECDEVMYCCKYKNNL